MLDKIESCPCGAVQGFWYLPGMEIPFSGKQMMGAHSPIGCFRTGGSESQVRGLYEELLKSSSDNLSYWVCFQVVISRLSSDPDEARMLGIVTVPVPLHPVKAYEIPSPAGVKRRGGTGGGTLRSPTPARVPVGWDPTTGRVKPPWEK